MLDREVIQNSCQSLVTCKRLVRRPETNGSIDGDQKPLYTRAGARCQIRRRVRPAQVRLSLPKINWDFANAAHISRLCYTMRFPATMQVEQRS